MSAVLPLPRNTTRQADTYITGYVARTLNRACGMIVVAFVLVHVVAEAILRVPALAPVNAGLPWLPVVQNQAWVHAILYFCIAFHTLYGLKLLAGDVGLRVPARASFLVIVGIAGLFALRELLRYVGL